MMAFEKRSRRMLARSLEGVLLIAIIIAVWLVMVMPVVIYFLVSILKPYILQAPRYYDSHHHAATESCITILQW